MKKVEDFECVCKAFHVEGLSIRETSCKYGHRRALIRKDLESVIRPNVVILQESTTSRQKFIAGR